MPPTPLLQQNSKAWRLSMPNASAPERCVDLVPRSGPGTREIGFDIPERYNASDILFSNLDLGRGNRLAVTGPAGDRTYAEICSEASKFGHALLSLGLCAGDRVL